MERGADPTSPEVRDLARQWQGLVAEFTGGDSGISESLGAMYREEPAVRQKTGITFEMMQFISEAIGRLDETGE